MASVFLHSVTLDLDPPDMDVWMQGAYKLFTESAIADSFGVHRLARTPEEADIIVFAELGAHGLFSELLRCHKYVKKFRDKCFLFDPSDFPIPFLPGLYASLKRSTYDPSRTVAGYYLRIDPNPYVEFRPPASDYRYLASFCGSFNTHSCRGELTKLPPDRFLIEDTSSFAQKALWSRDPTERDPFWSHYAESMASAPFALCPRGVGTGSTRLFEAMQMGRVPVIISDEYVYPQRVDWQACSITVQENEIARIPEILKAHQSRAQQMGLQARREWEKYFSPSTRFHWLVEDCLTIKGSRTMRESIAGNLIWGNLLDYETFRLYLSSKKQIYRATGRLLL